jgi:hypothetical protein
MEQTVAAHIGQAAGISSQAKKIANELMILRVISDNGWVREHEVQLITGLSAHTVSAVCDRLAKANMIYRDNRVPVTAEAKAEAKTEAKTMEVEGTSTQTKAKRKNGCTPYHAGFFLRLKKRGADRIGGKTGKDINIPECWRHTMLALQTLHYLSQKLSVSYETEHQIRMFGQKEKIPDGALLGKKEYHFEMEFSRKSGENMHSQSRTINRKAIGQVRCIIAYPYPAEYCEHDHERSLRQSLGYFLDNDKSREQIDFVRCHFASALDFDCVRPSAFEVIAAYPAIDHAYEREVANARARAQFHWDVEEVEGEECSSKQRECRVKLSRVEGVVFAGSFIERPYSGKPHLVTVDDSGVYKGEFDYLLPPESAQDKVIEFPDFIERMKQQIEMRNLEVWLQFDEAESDDSELFP